MLKREIYTSINQLDTDVWNGINKDQNIYLSISYLKALEDTLNDDIELYYSVSYNSDGTPALIAAFQLVTFIDKRRKYSDQLCKLSYHLHKKIADAFTINVLVCGNVFSDGENGFAWNIEVLNSAQAMDELHEIVQVLKRDENVKQKASITLFKEFWERKESYGERLKHHSYNEFMIDVNMVLSVHPSWQTMEDYFASMKTKFRTRANKVYRSSENLEIKTLDGNQIIAEEDVINKLYSNVLDKSDFSFGAMNAKAFAAFKKELNDKFIFKAAYYQDEMVGFSTSFINGDVLEANYVGLEYKFNKDLCIYQRLLFEYVELSIQMNAKELHLGRTAELIKSAIGAKPMNMKLYVKHRKTVSNLLLKPIISSISPSDFELRTPFKANFSN